LDLLPIFFLLLFVLLGGIIAVVADHVGRILGKKRLRIGNLRPKHTAMLGTFIMGVMVSLLTILLVTISSSDVRQWIVKGNRALRDLETAQQDLRNIRANVGEQNKKIDALDKEISDKTKQLSVQGAKLAGLNTKISSLQKDAEKANSRIKQLDRDRIATQQKLAERQAALKEQQARLAQVRNSLRLAQAATKHQQKLASDAAALSREASRQKLIADQENLKLINENTELEKNISALQEDIKRLSTNQQELVAAQEKAKQDLSSAEQQLGEYQAQLSSAQGDLQTIIQQVRMAQIAYAQVHGQARTERLIYNAGEEVARLPLDGGLSVSQAEDSLTALLRSARVAAIGRGAKRNEKAQEADIIEHTDPLTREPITREQIERQVVQQVAGAKGPVVIIASSSFNTFNGEPVSLELQVLPNPLVYTKGQVIAESVIDGNKDEEIILKQLDDLFSTRIRKRAQEDKMIPRLGSDQFGEVTPVDIYRLMNRVKAADRSIRVQALALADTRAADPLKLDFRLR
jgi:uncharacterized protein (DUF3084 family)